MFKLRELNNNLQNNLEIKEVKKSKLKL